MKHGKLIGLQTSAERLARVAAAAYDAATAPQTAPSGSISLDNADGTRTVIGPQSGDGTMATHVGDTTPPGRPTNVAGASSAGVVYIAWGGTLDGGMPADFSHVSIYMSVDGTSELVGTLTKAGIVSTVPMSTTATMEVWATAEDDACLADGTPAHNVSAESVHATVTVTQAADSDALAKLQAMVTTNAAALATWQASMEGRTSKLEQDSASFAALLKTHSSTLAQQSDRLDGVASVTSDVTSYMSFTDPNGGSPQLTIGTTASPMKTVITNQDIEFQRDGTPVMTIDGKRQSVQAQRVGIGSYEWQSTNAGANMTLVYIG